MSREFKFRAWDVDSSTMIHPEQIDRNDFFLEFHHGKLELVVMVEDDYPEKRASHIMQWTGLKDNNGCDIYEGDIIEGDSGDKHTIVFSVECGRFEAVCPFVNCALQQRWINEYNKKVVGNIYENPLSYGQ